MLLLPVTGEAQPRSPPVTAKSGGELRWPLHEVAGANPEPLQPAKRHANRLEVVHIYRGLRQHFELALKHDAHLVAQPRSLAGQSNADRAAVVQRAFLYQIAVFDHLLDVVGDVRAEITAAQRQFADGHLRISNVE